MVKHHENLTLSWHGENVNPVAVERALSQMLRKLAPPSEDGQEHPPARASVLSLIVRAADAEQGEQAMAMLGQLVEHYPSRTLMLTVDPAAPDSGLDAWASVYCLLHLAGSALVCFEQVRLAARGATAHHLASVAEPLLIPDLPVYLWWLGDPPTPGDNLLSLCDRLIVDTSQCEEGMLARVAELVTVLPPRTAVADLAWTALRPWREALASLFDPPETRVYQRSLQSVRVEYVPCSSPSRPLLLLGWLASSLGWQVASRAEGAAEDSLVVSFSAGAGSVEATLKAVPPSPEAKPGGVAGVLLSSEYEGRAASFAVTLGKPEGSAILHTALPDRAEITRSIRFVELSMAMLLGRELERLGMESQYYASLSMVEQVLKLIGAHREDHSLQTGSASL